MFAFSSFLDFESDCAVVWFCSDAHEKLQQEYRELQIQYYEIKERYDDMQEKLKFFTKVSVPPANRVVISFYNRAILVKWVSTLHYVNQLLWAKPELSMTLSLCVFDTLEMKFTPFKFVLCMELTH